MGFNSITQQAKPVKCNKFDGIQRKMFIFSLFNDILITCVLSHLFTSEFDCVCDARLFQVYVMLFQYNDNKCFCVNDSRI